MTPVAKEELFCEIFKAEVVAASDAALFIGTPKGKNHFYKLWELQKLRIPKIAEITATIDNEMRKRTDER